MKRFFTVAALVALALIVAACAPPAKTYRYAISLGTIGTCVEITTTDKNLQDAALAAGYELGTCAADGYTGNGCEYTAAALENATVTMYFQGYDATLLAAACSAVNGTVH